MPTNYELAPDDLVQTVKKVAKKYHPEIAKHVEITVMLATNTNGPALMHNGYQAAAIIRRTTEKDRVAGLADAVLIIDGNRLDEWTAETVDALIDHELQHLEIVYKDGEIARDNCGRPKLKLRKHDAQIGVFYSVIERHGPDALDTKIVAKLAEDTKQWVQPMLQWG